MKKVCLVVLSVFMLMFVAASCSGGDPISAKYPDLSECEIGYKLAVCPDVAFDYKISEGCVVHFNSITAELTAKNTIKADDTIEGMFYPYTIAIKFAGYVNADHGNKYMYMYLSSNDSMFQVWGKINSDGTFDIVSNMGKTHNGVIYFRSVTIYNLPVLT